MRVVFPYVAQLHQVYHSLPIAAEMATRHPQVEVHAAAATVEHGEFIRGLLNRYASHAPVVVELLEMPKLGNLPFKKKRPLMFRNRRYFRSFDAIVTPERTSLFLRHLGLGQTRLIWTRHGAGDRAIGFANGIDQFDYVLLAGKKIEERLLAAQQIRRGHYTTGVYAKLDWLASGPSMKVFDNDRPVVLYNPHFRPTLSSWQKMGHAVLEFFAAQPLWNLIFAPHVRLFDPPTPGKYQQFERYASLPNVRIDLGSERSIDMSYLNSADLYLGDVSSQVAEFVRRPRPCLFLNAHHVAWREDANYRFWHLGPVLETLEDFAQSLDRASSTHVEFLAAQRRYVTDTFAASDGASSAARGADAVVAYLEQWVPGPRRSEQFKSAAPRRGAHARL